jgi:hypothetical protein
MFCEIVSVEICTVTPRCKQHERKLFSIKELKNSQVGKASDLVINDKDVISCMSIEIFHHIQNRCQTYPSRCQYTIVTGHGLT